MATAKKTASKRAGSPSKKPNGSGSVAEDAVLDNGDRTLKPASKPSDFPVREGEEPWTAAEVDEVRADLEAEIVKHRKAIEQAESELQNLIHDTNEGGGRDAADVGSANFERDQEMSLAASAREMLDLSEQALRRIDQGTFGRCDTCGEPIGKGRLAVYPRATMCLACKQRHERR